MLTLKLITEKTDEVIKGLEKKHFATNAAALRLCSMATWRKSTPYRKASVC